MRPSTVAEVAARVAAWHNRHPLARRITAAQVQGVGVVAMPFVVPSPAREASREPTLFAAPDPAGGDPDGAALPASSSPQPDAAPAPAPSLRERALAAAAAGDAGGAPPNPEVPAPAPAAVPTSVLDRLRAWARSLRPVERRGFSEDFIDPLTPRRIARFALRHGSLTAPPPGAGPVREVLEDDGLCARGSVQTWHLRTAAIEVGSRRVRVLLGDGPDAAVIGPRLWSPGRIAGGALAWALAMSGLIAAQTMSRHAAETEVAVVAPAEQASAPARADPVPAPTAPAAQVAEATRAASAVVLPHGAEPAASVPPPPSAQAAASAPGPFTPVAEAVASALPLAAAPAAGPAAAAAVPVPAASSPAVSPAAAAPGPAPAPAWPVNIRPVIDVETVRAAKRESAALRAQGKGEPTTGTAERRADGVPPDKSAAPAADGTTYALAARSTRNRAASEVLLGLMKTAAAASGDKTQRTEVMAAQQGWRAIWWPFHTRQDAEKAQALLVSVGLEADLVEF